MEFPRYLSFILIIAAWQTYRILGAVFWSGLDLSGGGLFPNAWVIPLSQDTVVGLLAPLIVFMMATRPSVLSYALSVSFFVFGIVDFTNGLVVETLYPPFISPMGENVPASFITGWLIGNMMLEVVALALLLTPTVRRYFIQAEGGLGLSIKDSPMGGKWLWILGFAALNGIFFKQFAAVLNALFGMIASR